MNWPFTPAVCPQTVVNVEWGAFESQWLPRVAEDRDVDAHTPHAGKCCCVTAASGHDACTLWHLFYPCNACFN